MIYLVFMRDGKPMRYFPIGAKACDARVRSRWSRTSRRKPSCEVFFAAPAGRAAVSLVIDIGLLEI